MLRHVFKRREISRTTVSIEHDRSAKIIIIINSIYVSGYLVYKLIDDATKTDTDRNKMLKIINIVMKLYLRKCMIRMYRYISIRIQALKVN